VRYEVEVRISIERPLDDVWALACEVSSWPAMPGADLAIALTPFATEHRIEYSISAGLPVRHHHGELALTSTPTGGTELVFIEAFRPRIWGTGGYLRGRRERALIDTAQSWSRANSARAERPI
jgi:hypothetical protein